MLFWERLMIPVFSADTLSVDGINCYNVCLFYSLISHVQLYAKFKPRAFYSRILLLFIAYIDGACRRCEFS